MAAPGTPGRSDRDRRHPRGPMAPNGHREAGAGAATSGASSGSSREGRPRHESRHEHYRPQGDSRPDRAERLRASLVAAAAAGLDCPAFLTQGLATAGGATRASAPLRPTAAGSGGGATATDAAPKAHGASAGRTARRAASSAAALASVPPVRTSRRAAGRTGADGDDAKEEKETRRHQRRRTNPAAADEDAAERRPRHRRPEGPPGEVADGGNTERHHRHNHHHAEPPLPSGAPPNGATTDRRVHRSGRVVAAVDDGSDGAAPARRGEGRHHIHEASTASRTGRGSTTPSAPRSQPAARRPRRSASCSAGTTGRSEREGRRDLATGGTGRASPDDGAVGRRTGSGRSRRRSSLRATSSVASSGSLARSKRGVDGSYPGIASSSSASPRPGPTSGAHRRHQRRETTNEQRQKERPTLTEAARDAHKIDHEVDGDKGVHRQSKTRDDALPAGGAGNVTQNDVPIGLAWPSPFEADPFDDPEDKRKNESHDDDELKGSGQSAQKQRRQVRQRQRSSAAAAASTVLDTRRGRTPARPSLAEQRASSMATEIATPAPALIRSNSLEPNRVRRPQQQLFSSETDPHRRRTPLGTTTFGLPLTEPKKEVFSTPTAPRRSVSLAVYGRAAWPTVADLVVTPPKQRKTTERTHSLIQVSDAVTLTGRKASDNAFATSTLSDALSELHGHSPQNTQGTRSVCRSKSLDQYTSDELMGLRSLKNLSQEIGIAKVKRENAEDRTTVNGAAPGTSDEFGTYLNSGLSRPKMTDDIINGITKESLRLRTPPRTISGRNNQSTHGVSTGNHGKLHGHLRQTSGRENGLLSCQRSVVSSATRLRRHQSFSHTSSVGGLRAGIDNDVSTVVKTISRMKKHSPTTETTLEMKGGQKMTW